MTREEKQKAVDALKISAPVSVVTQEEFNDYIQTLNHVMDWLEQELCNDAINRQTVIDYECNFICGEGIRCVSGCRNINGIKALPSVQPKAKTGHWIKDNLWRKPYCSECGNSCFGVHGFDYITTDFCPNCGAKMESEDKE